MAVQARITYKDVTPSETLERLVQNETAKLERFFARIVDCRVFVDQSHHRRGAPYHVRIELDVPGEHLVVSQLADVRPASADDRIGKSADYDAEYKDPQLAIRDAFHKLERRLREYARRKSGATKTRLPPAPESSDRSG